MSDACMEEHAHMNMPYIYWVPCHLPSQVQLTIHVDRRQKHSLAAAAAGTASGSA